MILGLRAPQNRKLAGTSQKLAAKCLSKMRKKDACLRWEFNKVLAN